MKKTKYTEEQIIGVLLGDHAKTASRDHLKTGQA